LAIQIDITRLSGNCRIRRLTQADAEEILALCLGNSQSQTFWRKNSFVPTGTETEKNQYTAVVAERTLEPV